MIEWITKYWLEVLFGAMVAILSSLWTWLVTNSREPKEVQKHHEERFNQIDDRIIAVVDSIEDLKITINNNHDDLRACQLELLRPILFGDLKKVVRRGKMYEDEYEIINKEFEQYRRLGGNSVVCGWYKKANELPIISNKYENRGKDHEEE